jgi:hypothetical protein
MARVARSGTADSQAIMPAMIAGPSDRRGDRKAFAGSCAKDARDAKRPTLTPQRHPTAHRQGLWRSPRTSAPDTSEVSAVDGYQGPTEIPAGADDERDFEAEAAVAAKVTAEDAPAAKARMASISSRLKGFSSPQVIALHASQAPLN